MSTNHCVISLCCLNKLTFRINNHEKAKHDVINILTIEDMGYTQLVSRMWLCTNFVSGVKHSYITQIVRTLID